MRFIILGAGRVGLRTARAIRGSAHEVVVVDPDEEAVERARSEGFSVIQGDAASEDVLLEAGVAEADAVGALTGDLNANYAACAIANQYGCRTVMRIDEDYREDIYRRYVEEVDQIVYPERLGAILAKNALTGGNIRAIADIEQSLQIVEFTITSDSPMEDYTLSELELPGTARLIAYGSKGNPLRLPTPDDALENGDRVVVLGDVETLDEIRQLIVGDGAQAQPGGV
ncbi:TrkA family potassium uptake protein [Halovenus sp. WSH3]|uniref:TrkA family potassium uptake protein n=1 Tax=Halovenus carboxidivorans TaxID=2692199 RepID=A0A6B0T2B1_9EURY|nr:TrkA family potassium uptake protein [Halovenus carboxidivorans]MXR52204.1 TrkA family potassium uptake protein [Halovenus carboxidivorans]